MQYTSFDTFKLKLIDFLLHNQRLNLPEIYDFTVVNSGAKVDFTRNFKDWFWSE